MLMTTLPDFENVGVRGLLLAMQRVTLFPIA
jgi:hypothetical protein